VLRLRFLQGAPPLGTLLLSLKERSKEAVWPKTLFSAGDLRIPPRKTQFFAFSKFLKILKELFSKSSLSGCRAEPSVLRLRLSQGAPPLGTLLLSLKERSKEAVWPKTLFSAGDLRIPPRKTQFFAFSKFLKILKELFSKSSLSGCRAEPCVLRLRFSQGAPPLGTLLLSLKERSKEAVWPKTLFSAGDLRIPPRKTQFFAFPKFLKFLKTSFKKFLSGCGAEPCVLRLRLSQGAPPLGTLLLSLKERSKEAFMAENLVFGRGT